MPNKNTKKEEKENSPAKKHSDPSIENIKEIFDSLAAKDEKNLKKLLGSLHFADIADLIDIASHDQRQDIINFLRDDFNPEILVELDHNVREEILEILGTKESAKVIGELETDDAVDVIEDLSEEEQQEILQAMPKKDRAELEEGLAYPEDSAGRLIEKGVVSVPQFWTVGQTIDHLRSEENLPDNFYEIFVVDPKGKPIGSVMLSGVLRSKREKKLTQLMNTQIRTIKTDTDQEEVAFIFRQYGLASAPVVNDEGRMVGVINIDDIVDVINEEAQEDIMHLGGVSETDLHSGLSLTVKRRFPWLAINLITAVIASVVIGFFENEIEKLAALAVLMPIIASMGGNAGTQSLTIAVRAIATKELTTTNTLRVVTKEVLVGAVNGLAFAVAAGVLTYIWYENLGLSIIFAIATVFTLPIAGFAGAVIPLGLVRIGVDPAVASGVVLTTVTDVVAFAAFLGFSAMVIL